MLPPPDPQVLEELFDSLVLMPSSPQRSRSLDSGLKDKDSILDSDDTSTLAPALPINRTRSGTVIGRARSGTIKSGATLAIGNGVRGPPPTRTRSGTIVPSTTRARAAAASWHRNRWWDLELEVGVSWQPLEILLEPGVAVLSRLPALWDLLLLQAVLVTEASLPLQTGIAVVALSLTQSESSISGVSYPSGLHGIFFVRLSIISSMFGGALTKFRQVGIEVARIIDKFRIVDLLLYRL
ncbi:hypothetical protein BDZ89DRAFT_1141843 [Hymenopellis radicata]|nr:hypothetical protein BDZ89DRAFT_1141843 [Hymenopellis radicata]